MLNQKQLLGILAILGVAIFSFIIIFLLTRPKPIETVPPAAPTASVTNFAECAEAGNPIMESYPRQCRHNDITYTEEIGNELAVMDLIRINTPRPNDVISSPLVITGEARGTWFFEADFPVLLVDWDGLIIAEGVATAKSDWMTEEFVPFEATLTFAVDPNSYSNRGALILQKDNPSGLPEHDNALEVPIRYADIVGSTQ